MLFQIDYSVPVSPQTAFDCAVKTLYTFQSLNAEKWTHVNHRFLTITKPILYRTNHDGLAAAIKVVCVRIQALENGSSQVYISCDHLPARAYNSGSIMVTVAEFWDRYIQMLDQMQQGNGSAPG